MVFGILVIALLAAGVIYAFMPLRRSEVCPKCSTQNSSRQIQCPNCRHVGLKGKVSAGGIGPAHVTWTCPACKKSPAEITCKRCGSGLLKLFTS